MTSVAKPVVSEAHQRLCPATFCPLFAKNGSPWTGGYRAPCPGHDDIKRGGCPWWGAACGENGNMDVVTEAELNGGLALVVGPEKPKRCKGAPRAFDCPHAHECVWQERSPTGLCAPREALNIGMDPKVVAF